MVHGGVLLPEDLAARDLQVPHRGVDAEALQGLEEGGGGGLLPHLGQIQGGNGHEEDGLPSGMRREKKEVMKRTKQKR